MTLSYNDDDAPFAFLPLGAILQTFLVPTSPTSSANIVLGYPSQDHYAQLPSQSFYGETIGRVANRIHDATIRSLNRAQTYKLQSADDRGHTLHGGDKGWGKRVWDGPSPAGVVDLDSWGLEEKIEDGGEAVLFTLHSQDGDEGFPGAVVAKAWYAGAVQRDGQGREVRVLGMEYEAEIVDDTEETVVNMTNHSYFNLSGSSTVTGTSMALSSTTILPLDETSIPTGAPPTPYKLLAPNVPFTLGHEEPDLDDLFLVTDANGNVPDPETIPVDTRTRPLSLVAKASHPDSGIHLEVLTTEPAFQVYTGKYIDTPAIGGVEARGKRAGFCIEPSRYINAVNDPKHRSMVVLKNNQKYGSRIVYRAWKE